MSPQMALRRLERLLATTDAPRAKLDEAEVCFRVLWEHVMRGSEGS